jgi:hypothetical protein
MKSSMLLRRFTLTSALLALLPLLLLVSKPLRRLGLAAAVGRLHVEEGGHTRHGRVGAHSKYGLLAGK